MMAVLTFITAPWAVGTLYRRKHIYVALCAWLFSASWCYDLYLVLRDGRYPDTWQANMAASSILYVLAGLLWNLEWRAGRGVTFGFLVGLMQIGALRLRRHVALAGHHLLHRHRQSHQR